MHIPIIGEIAWNRLIRYSELRFQTTEFILPTGGKAGNKIVGGENNLDVICNMTLYFTAPQQEQRLCGCLADCHGTVRKDSHFSSDDCFHTHAAEIMSSHPSICGDYAPNISTINQFFSDHFEQDIFPCRSTEVNEILTKGDQIWNSPFSELFLSSIGAYKLTSQMLKNTVFVRSAPNFSLIVFQSLFQTSFYFWKQYGFDNYTLHS